MRSLVSIAFCVWATGVINFFVLFSGVFFFNKPDIGHVILLAGKCDFCRYTRRAGSCLTGDTI